MGACGSIKQASAPEAGEAPVPAVVPCAAGTLLHRSRSSSSKSLSSEGRVVKVRSQLVLDRSGCIHDAYVIESKKLGEGCNGVVRQGTRRSTGVVRAIKSVSKKQVRDVTEFKQEIEVMKMMDHPNIIKLFETFEDKKRIYLVMELCEGGELFDRIIEAGCFTEREAAVVMQQILRAVFYMHENNMAHRDLKPENFLFLTREPIESNVLKLIDFGLSCQSLPGAVHRTVVGTPQYVAPQVLSKRYDRRCDLWSCGVIMYTLLSGRSPFAGKNEHEVLQKVRQGCVSLAGEAWEHVSADAKGLVGMLLKRNPRERCSAEQALNHDWIKETAPRAADVQLADGFVESLRDFCSQKRLRKAALHVIADQLSEAHTRRLRETFNALDRTGNGVLTLSDLKEGLQRAGLRDSAPDLEEILEGVDIGGSGVIDYTEFLAATLDRDSCLQDDVCWTAFNVFNLDAEGTISQRELLRTLDGSGCNSVDPACGQSDSKGLWGRTMGQDIARLNFEDFLTIVRDDPNSMAATTSLRATPMPPDERQEG